MKYFIIGLLTYLLTITNAFRENLTTRGTASNMGRADSLEVFSIYAQENSGSSELSRILVQFPISDVSTDRANGVLPASGSVNFSKNSLLLEEL